MLGYGRDLTQQLFAVLMSLSRRQIPLGACRLEGFFKGSEHLLPLFAIVGVGFLSQVQLGLVEWEAAL